MTDQNTMAKSPAADRITGGVDTHKDLHVAAVVDDRDRFLESACFPTARQGYRQLLAWMQSFGPLGKVGVEATGTYGAGLLRHLQKSASRRWKSLRPTDRTGASVARAIIWTPRPQPTPPLPGSAR
jgi:transposase